MRRTNFCQKQQNQNKTKERYPEFKLNVEYSEECAWHLAVG